GLIYGPKRAGRFGERIVTAEGSPGADGTLGARFDVPETGAYLLVVGTENGTGRGSYTASLRCDSGECGPRTSDLECPEGLSRAVSACVDDTVQLARPGRVTEYEVFLDCTTNRVDQVWQAYCRGEPSTAAEGVAAEDCAPSSDLLAACVLALDERYPLPIPPVSTEPIELSPAQRGVLRDVDCSDCSVELEAIRLA